MPLVLSFILLLPSAFALLRCDGTEMANTTAKDVIKTATKALEGQRMDVMEETGNIYPAVFNPPDILEVLLSLHITDLQDFNTEGFLFRGEVNSSWCEPALSWNIGPSMLKLINPSIVNQLWTPRLAIENGEIRNDPADRFQIFLVESNGFVTLVDKWIIARVVCDQDLKKFPFDVQLCSLEFTMPYFQAHEVHLVLANISIANLKEDVSLYLNKPNDGESVSSATLELQRNWNGYVIEVYFPTISLTLIGITPFFISIEDLADRLSIEITILLVIQTITMTMQSSLPAVDYLMAIDIWLVGMQIFLFLSIAYFVIIHKMCERGRHEAKRYEKADRIALLFMTALLLIFTIAYVIVYIA